MKNEFVCVPIHTLGGEVIGVDLNPYIDDNRIATQVRYSQLSFPEKQDLLFQQLLMIEQQTDFFRQHRLFCSIYIDFHLARAITAENFIQQILSQLPFIRLKLSEDFPNLHDGLNNPLIRTLMEQRNVFWLNNLGAGYANLNALQSRIFEAVKLDTRFYHKNVNKTFFPVLIRHIRQYTNQIIVEGVQSELQLETLRRSKIWGVQGYYHPVLPLDTLPIPQSGI